MPKDRFHEYLDYCDTVEIVGVGDYIETVARTNEVLAWTQLIRDCMDTHKAGLLLKVRAKNGSTAYVRPGCAKLPPSASKSKSSRRESA